MINLPAYCQKCKVIYPSGYFIGFTPELILSDNFSTCPNGHQGKVIDGTFQVINDLLILKYSGKNTAEIINKLRELADSARIGTIDPKDALDEAVSIFPGEVGIVVKKFGIDHPIAIILIMIYVLSGVFNVIGGVKGLMPNIPSPPTVVNISTTTNSYVTSGQKEDKRVYKLTKREQARRLAQKDREAKKRLRERGKSPP